MTADGDAFDGGAIRELLTELGRRLAANGIEARLFLVGGAAMALAYSRSRVTRDLDAVFEPKAEIYREAQSLADERGVPSAWLNDGVKGLLPDREPPAYGSAGFSAPGINVGIATPEYLFAMKAAAARGEADADDLRILARELGLTSAAQALALVDRFYAPGRLTIKTQFFVEEVMSSL